MNIWKTFLIISLVLATGFGGYLWLTRGIHDLSSPADTCTKMGEWRKFVSPQHGYFFCYPTDLQGGTQKSDNPAILETVFFKSPPNENDRIAVFVTVERPAMASADLVKLASKYELGSEIAGARLSTLSSHQFSKDGTIYLEKTYTSDSPGMTYTAVRFALVNGKSYISGILRGTDSPTTHDLQTKIFDSMKID